MIDLTALKEQLRLLGHNLPDDQIKNILADMNIDVEDDDVATPDDVATRSPPPMSGPGVAAQQHRTGSILDNIQGKTSTRSMFQGPEPELMPWATGSAVGPAAAPAWAPSSSTGPTAQGAYPFAAAAAPGTSASRPAPAAPLLGHSSSASARQSAPGAGRSQPGATAGFASAYSPPDAVAGRAAAAPQHSMRPSHEDDVASGLEHWDRASVLSKAWDVRPGSAVAAVAGPASAVPYKPGGAVGRYAAEGSSPSGRFGPLDAADVSSPRDARAKQQLRHSPTEGAYVPKRPADKGPGAAAQPSPQELPSSSTKPKWTDLPRDVSPMGRSTLSQQVSTSSFGGRSSASRASTATKKVDRVARWQELQQGWDKNRFLTKASGTTKGTNRKPVNFNSHFANLHAEEAMQRERMLKETRTKTKQDIAVANAYVAPTAKRRDDLRWQTRQRLLNGE